METKDIMLAKAKFKDWESIYHNVWLRPETARYMQWQITESEEAAKERMQKTIAYQKIHDTYLVYEKKSGEAIGFAGVEEIAPHIFKMRALHLALCTLEKVMENKFCNCYLNIAFLWEGRNPFIQHRQRMWPQKPWLYLAVSLTVTQGRKQICELANLMS